MHCPHCGGKVSDNAKVCGHCGQWLAAANRCPHCRAELPAQARVCGHCGQPLGVPSVPPQAAGLPGWALAVGGVLVILVVVLAVALIVPMVMSSRAGPTPSVGVARHTRRPATATPLVPTPPPTDTPAPPTDTPVPPTDTPVPPTDTPVPPTDTPLPPTPTPSPTSTPMPLPTPTPQVLLFDDFSNPGSGWEVGSWNEMRIGYRDGFYFVEDLAHFGFAYALLTNRSFDNLVVEVDATWVNGPAEGMHGVICRAQPNSGDGYVLAITAGGQAGIYKSIGEGTETLADWTTSDAIRQGNATNHIRAVCSGSSFTLSVNGVEVAGTTDPASSYSHGTIGFISSAGEGQSSEAHFDNLRVLKP